MDAPLITDRKLSPEMLLGTNTEAATWLTYVGLRGRYAAVPFKHYWVRHTGSGWIRCPAEDVNAAVRRALTDAHERLQRQGSHDPRALLELLDVNWQLGGLLAALRNVATVDLDAVALLPQSPTTQRELVRVGSLRRCGGCSMEANSGALRMHQKYSGHDGWTEVYR